MNCSICKRELNTTNPLSQDCGGDCLACMAEAGDPDCIKSLIEQVDTLHKLDAENNHRLSMYENHMLGPIDVIAQKAKSFLLGEFGFELKQEEDGKFSITAKEIKK